MAVRYGERGATCASINSLLIEAQVAPRSPYRTDHLSVPQGETPSHNFYIIASAKSLY